jgi:hypothetical protein
MGSLQAAEMASLTDLDTALTWHLRGNHYPPIPLTMLEPCKEAIDAYWEDNVDKLIDMPEGVFYKGMTQAPAWAIIEQHHLDAWCSEDEETDEDWLMSNT